MVLIRIRQEPLSQFSFPCLNSPTEPLVLWMFIRGPSTKPFNWHPPFQRVKTSDPPMEIIVPSTFAWPPALLIFTVSILERKRKATVRNASAELMVKLKGWPEYEMEKKILPSKDYLRRTAMRNVKLGITLFKAEATVGEVYVKPK